MTESTGRMLVLAPHPDDSLLGAGGTMIRFIRAGGEVVVITLAAHKPPLFTEEVFRGSVEEVRSAHLKMGVQESIFLNHPALSLHQIPRHELNRIIEDALARLHPELLIVPYFDVNTDHRAVFESTMVASRAFAQTPSPLVVAAYETLSTTHFNAPQVEPAFQPNWIVDITDYIEEKLSLLRGCRIQMRPLPHPRSLEVVHSLAQLRGSQAGVRSGEAFQVIRMTALPEVLRGTRSSVDKRRAPGR